MFLTPQGIVQSGNINPLTNQILISSNSKNWNNFESFANPITQTPNKNHHESTTTFV